MSSPKVRPALIGLFTLIALAGALLAAVKLGAGNLNRRQTEYALYFDQDISGLDVGAPVTLRGVRVGEVTDIRVVYDAAIHQFRIPITVAIQEDVIHIENAGPPTGKQDLHKFHVERGLRAQLDSQSLVTGKLKISLDYHPRSPLVYNEHHRGPLQQIPTIPTLLVSLGKKIEELSLESTLARLGESAGNISKWLSGGQIERVISELLLTMEASRRVLAEDAPSVSARMEVLMDELQKTAISTRNLMEYLERHPDALLKGKSP